MYNTIEKKKCKCQECQDNPEKAKWPTIGCKGFFFAHAPEDLKVLIGTKRQLQVRNKNRRNVIAFKARVYQKKLDNSENIELWFRYQMQVSIKICDNCGGNLSHYNNWEWRSSQNHIVDKSELNGCPSVASHPLNHNVLGVWCCHSQWGTSFLNQSKMPCFAKAKEKFEKFKADIAPSEIRKVNPYLL